MSSPITVRGIGENRHSTSKYVVTLIYFGGLRDGNPIITLLTRKAHVVSGLKAKILLGIDVIGPKKFELLLAKKSVHIDSYNVNIQIDLKLKGRQVRQVVSATFSLIIPPNTQATIPVHHIILPQNRDFLFEPDHVNHGLTLYAHVINANLSFIIARNETKKPLKIPRNYRLKKVTKMDFNGCYHANAKYEDILNLAARRPSNYHKNNWIRRAFIAAITIIAATNLATHNKTTTHLIDTIECQLAEQTHKITLPNGITIHGNTSTARQLQRTVEEFPFI